MNKITAPFLVLFLCLASCQSQKETSIAKVKKDTPFLWEASNMYFLLTDRFNNGTTANDTTLGRTKKSAVLRGFEGGDIVGITQKIKEGYFTDLGIQSIWLTPFVENIHAQVDEGTGPTYGYHGYWAKDWTQIDPNFGTYQELKTLVATAHQHNIRIVMDVVLNHTGPETDIDPFWGDDWARRGPKCAFTTYQNTTACALVENLPDIRTESEEEVGIPAPLANKWRAEGRYEQEVAELNAWFLKTNMKRTPRSYIMKWLTDYVRELGIDAFRVDTAKHVNEGSWIVLRALAEAAFRDWKKANPNQVIDPNTPFYMFGEVYNYSVDAGLDFDLGDTKVNYFNNGFDGLINFEFKRDALGSYELLFSKYDTLIHTTFKDRSFINYATSHDDGEPFDKNRSKNKETATKLLLTQGISQVYYGDETARNLTIPGTQGDATLRSFMNWDAIDNPKTNDIYKHWQKLGTFRANHPAIGAGKHQKISDTPYVFKRTLQKKEFTDEVVIGLELPIGKKEIELNGAFAKAKTVKDHYSGKTIAVHNGKIVIDTAFDTVLLEQLD